MREVGPWPKVASFDDATKQSTQSWCQRYVGGWRGYLESLLWIVPFSALAEPKTARKNGSVSQNGNGKVKVGVENGDGMLLHPEH